MIFLHFTMTLTYNSTLAKAKVNLDTEYQGCRSDSSAVRGLTDTTLGTNLRLFFPILSHPSFP